MDTPKNTPEKYEEAMERLQAIVKQIENGETDVDQLATNLKEAKELISFCQECLLKVEAEVKQTLE